MIVGVMSSKSSKRMLGVAMDSISQQMARFCNEMNNKASYMNGKTPKWIAKLLDK